jgi:hypothetical protein
MSDLIVVAGALFGGLVILAGIGWLVPALRRRFTGPRTGTAGGPVPGGVLILAGAGLLAVSLGVVSDGSGASADGDIAATCALLEGGEDSITVESMNAIIAVAPESVAASVRTVRDRFAVVGEAAFDEPAVGVAFNSVAAFETEECGV